MSLLDKLFGNSSSDRFSFPGTSRENGGSYRGVRSGSSNAGVGYTRYVKDSSSGRRWSIREHSKANSNKHLK